MKQELKDRKRLIDQSFPGSVDTLHWAGGRRRRLPELPGCVSMVMYCRQAIEFRLLHDPPLPGVGQGEIEFMGNPKDTQRVTSHILRVAVEEPSILRCIFYSSILYSMY
nr:hypothetical protein CFP56_68100 [Quercus suber]